MCSWQINVEYSNISDAEVGKYFTTGVFSPLGVSHKDVHFHEFCNIDIESDWSCIVTMMQCI